MMHTHIRWGFWRSLLAFLVYASVKAVFSRNSAPKARLVCEKTAFTDVNKKCKQAATRTLTVYVCVGVHKATWKKTMRVTPGCVTQKIQPCKRNATFVYTELRKHFFYWILISTSLYALMAAARIQRDVLQMFYGPIPREQNGILHRPLLHPQQISRLDLFILSQSNFLGMASCLENGYFRKKSRQ